MKVTSVIKSLLLASGALPIVSLPPQISMLKTLVFGILFAITFSGTSSAQDKPANKTVWDGVYSPEQAARGKLEYENHCASGCHGLDLTEGRPINGAVFLERWRESQLDPLFNYIKMAMPRGAGGSLADDVYLDIFTYVLQRNGFPEGREPLTVERMPVIDLIGKDGPKPVPDGALVVTVGCMMRGPLNRWFLVNASEPVRTRTPDETSQEELKAAQASPPGRLVFELQDFDAILSSRPSNFDGLRMQAKGNLVRQAGAERISLFHLAMISASCPK